MDRFLWYRIISTSWKEGHNMFIQEHNNLYAIKYNHTSYYAMDFKRLDWINGMCYMTFYQADTGKWFTFERNKMKWMTKEKQNLVS